MKFGPIPLEEAKGAIMAHSQRLGERMIRKGSVLDDSAVAALREAGRSEVIAARLEPGDVPEDIAADRLAQPLVAPLLSRSRAATGRVNLSADVPGLLRVDAARVNRVNAIDESLTLGTVPDYSVVTAKDLVATVKVIPFAVAGGVLSVAEAIVRQGGLFTLHPFRPLKVGMVATELPGLKETVTEKTIAVTEGRVTQLGGTLLPTLRTPHAEVPIAAALETLIGQGAELLLVVGASAVVDRRDVGPAGIGRAGGEILHFGMPVDPGNLICLGRIGDRPALVMPGCARSPKQNGIDFILPRLFAGLRVGPADFMGLGVGGLLKETDARPLPREKAPAVARTGPAPRSAPTIAAVGTGRRPLAANGTAQQAADRRSHRQADDRARGGQCTVQQGAADPGGDRASGRSDRARVGRPASALRSRGGLRRGPLRQSQGRDRGGPAGSRGRAGLFGRHAVGDWAYDRSIAGDL